MKIIGNILGGVTAFNFLKIPGWGGVPADSKVQIQNEKYRSTYHYSNDYEDYAGLIHSSTFEYSNSETPCFTYLGHLPIADWKKGTSRLYYCATKGAAIVI